MSPVVFAHIRTLRTLGKPGVNISDLLFFFGLPAVIALPLSYCCLAELHTKGSDILTAVSIIGGFLFGLLGMIVNVIEKVKREHSDNIVKKVFAREIHANIAFGIIQSLACVLSMIAYGFLTPSGKDKTLSAFWDSVKNKASFESILEWIRSSSFSLEVAVAWINYFLLISFFLTLLMIVKRIFIIMNSDAQELA